MNRYLLIIADELTLPIDEGLKKFTFKLMEYGTKRDWIDVCSSPEDVGLENITLFQANKLMMSGEIKALLNKKSYTDIVYIPEASTTFGSFIRAFFIKMQAPQNATIHVVSSQKRILKKWQRFVVSFMSGLSVITFSQSANKYIQRIGLCSSFYPLATDTNVFKPVSHFERNVLREKYGITKDDRVALHVGHIKKSRNIGILKQLAEKRWKVIVVGSTSKAYEEDVANDLKEHGVIVLGNYNPHVEELYQLADIYVFPVINEDEAIEFPLSVLEAMACGLPVLSTRFGALPEHLSETPSFGYFDETKDLCQLAEKYYKADAICNREIVMDYFSWDNVCERILGKE